jgi:5,10-methenyltetrahydrofolate synthetase
MAGEKDPPEDAGAFASPPCFMHELDASATPLPDAELARDVARFRKAERERLIAARLALTVEERAAHAQRIARDLDGIVPCTAGTIVGAYWPFRGEPDLRSWLGDIITRGMRAALPVVVGKGQPLVFRDWSPGARLERGVWNIPHPADGATVTPQVVIAPLVGFDRANYRLGYGGGFYDRTLARLSPRPLVIGVGHPVGEMATIFPQPYDIPMDWVVTGHTPPRRAAP